MTNISTDIGAPGSIEVLELTIEKFDGGRKADIKSIAAAIEITSSILNPTIFGKLVIIDYMDFLNNENLTITGEEFFNISFRRRNTQKTFTYKFVISTMNVENKSPSTDSAIAVLTLLSVDTFINSASFKSKGYNGTIDSIIKEIIKDELASEIPISDKFVETEGQVTFAFTEIKPFEKVQIISPRAFNNNPSITSIFMFYENMSGYNFEPFEDMMTRAEANTNIIEYTHTQLEVIDREIEYNGILQYSPKGTFDNHRRMFHGLYNTKLLRFDLITKSLNVDYFNILDNIDNFKHLNRPDPGISTKFSSQAKNLGSLTYFIPYDSSIIDYTGESLSKNSPLSILLDENSLAIKVFGNLDYDVGDPINVVIMDNSSTQDTEKKADPRYSGKYLIHSITYSIGLDKHGFTMLNNLMLVRDGVLRNVDFYDKQYVTGDIKIPAFNNASNIASITSGVQGANQ